MNDTSKALRVALLIDAAEGYKGMLKAQHATEAERTLYRLMLREAEAMIEEVSRS